MEPQQILVFALVAIAAGGAFYAVAYPTLAGGGRAEKRQKSIYQSTGGRIQPAGRDTAVRRGAVAESLKELERREKNRRSPPLSVRLEQTGLDWTPRRFYIASAILSVVVAFMVYLTTLSPLMALGAAFAAGLGLPRWILKFMIKRRQTKFIKEFPNAIDIIVRGVKSGLPLGDCIRIVASESQEPVRGEFRAILETQAVGMPLGDAVDRLYQRLGLPEANFFAIVISIQSKAGGNLSEALGNLARVLRERQKMKGKIQAMSMEAKASAWIIGMLPVIVGFLVYLVSPEYISQLWERPMGLVLLGISAFWMTCGVLVMRQMINFDF